MFDYLYHKISNEEYICVCQTLFKWQMPQVTLRMESCGLPLVEKHFIDVLIEEEVRGNTPQWQFKKGLWGSI